jgi:hypothetical protein
MNMRFLKKYGAAGAALLSAGLAKAQVVTYATPEAALAGVGDVGTDMAPTLYGLAALASAIVIGIAWIKKSRGAAK